MATGAIAPGIFEKVGLSPMKNLELKSQNEGKSQKSLVILIRDDFLILLSHKEITKKIIFIKHVGDEFVFVNERTLSDFGKIC